MSVLPTCGHFLFLGDEKQFTNRDIKRFLTITRKIHTHQFYYTYTLFTENRNITACQRPGHNKKKTTKAVPSQPAIHFEDSDNEATADM